MHLFEARNIITKQLEPVYLENETPPMTDILIEWVTGLDRLQQIAQPKKEITEEQQLLLQEGVIRLLSFEPIQYITKHAWFAGYRFKVGPAVLIPRPETEELVDWILKEKPDKESYHVLDVGTGSGCIPVSLKKKRPGWTVTAIDISQDALAVAKENADELGAEVDFKAVDLTDEAKWSSLGEIDLLVSNPPYIPWSDWNTLPENVREHEPSEALFVPDTDPLLFYRLIAQLAKRQLKKEGVIYLELNETLGAEVVSLFQAQGFATIELKKDMQGKHRMLRVSI
ncbi:MAG: protein-(glutamine-N5) methyltransferase, release factor-specific [Sphingobacteriales bacterium 12-47-4]|nr:MAG: protein-(glutamine-N5) methyltransferase, release factor-specific [Sphingobacteriales bacterium 12-47-4]